MRLRIASIHEAAASRPPGYVADVLARGTTDGEWLEISTEALAELRHLYRPEAPLPPISAMVANASQAAAAEVRARIQGRPAVSEEEIARRIAICHTCPHFRESDQRCALCGCPAAWKTKLRSQACPAGKW